MEKRIPTAHSADVKLKLEKHYVRLMELGLSLWLSMPFAVMLLKYTGLWTQGIILMTCLILGGTGYACLEHGWNERKKLQQDNPPDCPE